MKEKQYRKKLKSEVKQAQADYIANGLRELQGDRPVRAAMAMDKASETPTRRSVEAALKAMHESKAFDTSLEADVRIKAFASGSLAIGSNKALTERTIRLIGNAKEVEAIRIAALDAFLRATFSLRQMADWRPLYIETFRRIAETETNEVASRALRVLAQENDDWALAKIQEGLRKPSEAVVAPLQAVQQLAKDDHGDHFDLLRDLAQKNRSRKVREEAIRGLSADPSSTQLLSGLAENGAEPTSVRQAALVSLRHLNPEEHFRVAAAIVENPKEDDELRATCLTTLRLNPNADKSYDSTVQKIKDEAESKVMRKAAQMYLPEE